MKEMMKKLMMLAVVCGLGFAAQAEGFDPVPWTVDMYDDCLSPYTDRTKSENRWYPNMTAYLLDANVVAADTVQNQLEQGDRSVLTGAAYLAQTNGVNTWSIKSWTMPTGGKKISVTGGMFNGRSDVLLVYLTDTSTTSAMFAVAQATASISATDPNPSAVFNAVSDPGDWTYFPANISGVTARQRYPWNGKVDIAYTAENVLVTANLQGLDVTPQVMAIDKTTTPWTTNVAEAAALFLGPLGDRPLPLEAALSNGAHRIVWDMNAQGLSNKSDRVVFTVSAEGKAE